jgi:endonuclease/exonuclease/phosphatase family metal-dependent hydrolase
MKKISMLAAVVAGLAIASGCCCAKREVRFMSYNVHHCEGADKKVDLKRIASIINNERPDFAGLQELDCAAARSGGVDQPTELGKLTGMHVTYAKAIPLQGGSYGVALLSREKPLSVFRAPLPGKEPRVLLLCEFADCWVGTTHLSLDAECRLQAVEIMRGAVAERAGSKPVYLTGDWNAEPHSKELEAVRGFMKLLSAAKGRTFYGFKTHDPSSEFCIDYVAVDSASASAVGVKSTYVVAECEASDHCPVVVVVEKTRK